MLTEPCTFKQWMHFRTQHPLQKSAHKTIKEQNFRLHLYGKLLTIKMDVHTINMEELEASMPLESYDLDVITQSW